MKPTNRLFTIIVVIISFVPRVCIAQSPFWQQLTLPSYPEWGSQVVQSIRFDPLGHIFAASDYGIIRSLDSGATWTNVLSAGLASSISITSAGTIFVGNGSVWRSTDDGDSWLHMNNGLNSTQIVAVAAKADGYVFAGSRDGFVFRSTDNGTSWKRLPLNLTRCPGLQQIDISADGTVLVASNCGRLYRSYNNGKSWGICHVVSVFGIPFWTIATNGQGEIFVAQQGFKVATRQYYISVFRSVDNGHRFTNIAQLSGQNYPLSIDADESGNVVLGTSPGVYTSSNHGISWNQRDSGLINSNIHAIRISREGIIYAGAVSGWMFRSIQPLSSTGMQTEMGQKFPDQPLSFSLHQNYPNPFNPTTILEYSMPVESNVRIIVYNTIGQVVATLVHGVQMPGSNSIEWNASTFASGIYFYRMEATGVSNPTKTFTQVKKMILMK